MITGNQIRAARVLARLNQADLAKLAGVSLATLNNFEREMTNPKRSTMERLVKALEGVGVRFINDRAEIGAVVTNRAETGAD